MRENTAVSRMIGHSSLHGTEDCKCPCYDLAIDRGIYALKLETLLRNLYSNYELGKDVDEMIAGALNAG